MVLAFRPIVKQRLSESSPIAIFCALEAPFLLIVGLGKWRFNRHSLTGRRKEGRVIADDACAAGENVRRRGAALRRSHALAMARTLSRIRPRIRSIIEVELLALNLEKRRGIMDEVLLFYFM